MGVAFGGRIRTQRHFVLCSLWLECLLIIIEIMTTFFSNFLQGPGQRKSVKNMVISHVSTDFGKEKGMADGTGRREWTKNF